MYNFLFSLWKVEYLKIFIGMLILVPVTNFTKSLHSLLLWTSSEVIQWGLNDFIQLLNIFIAPIRHLMMLPVWCHLRDFVCHSSLKNHSWKTDYIRAKWCFPVRKPWKELLTCPYFQRVDLIFLHPTGLSRIVCKDLLLTPSYYLLPDFLTYQPVGLKLNMSVAGQVLFGIICSHLLFLDVVLCSCSQLWNTLCFLDLTGNYLGRSFQFISNFLSQKDKCP